MSSSIPFIKQNLISSPSLLRFRQRMTWYRLVVVFAPVFRYIGWRLWFSGFISLLHLKEDESRKWKHFYFKGIKAAAELDVCKPHHTFHLLQLTKDAECWRPADSMHIHESTEWAVRPKHDRYSCSCFSFILCWPLNSVLAFLFLSSQDADNQMLINPYFKQVTLNMNIQVYHYYWLIDRIFKANINI